MLNVNDMLMYTHKELYQCDTSEYNDVVNRYTTMSNDEKERFINAWKNNSKCLINKPTPSYMAKHVNLFKMDANKGGN